jgi:hypothetical protein
MKRCGRWAGKTAAQAGKVLGALTQAAGEKARWVAARLGEFLPRLRQGIILISDPD